MTRKKYSELPELLRPNVFLEITGLTKYNVAQLVETGNLTFFQPEKRAARLFHKKNLETLGIVED